MDIYSTINDNFRRFLFIPDQAVIVAAFSGGRDSTALLHLLLELKHEIKLRVQAAYFNHQIRPDAPQEEAWVREQCDKLDIPLHVGHGNIPELKRSQGGNLEEIASDERYKFLFRTLDSLDQPAYLATAHHAGDQLETFLFRLTRGSGPHGLLGIFPHIEKRLIRPMHNISPKQIETYLSERNIPWYQDPSNENRDFSRNRIRHHVLPELERLNPKLYASFSRGLAILAEEDAFLQDLSEQELKRISPIPNALSRPELLALPVSMSRRVLRLFIARNRGNLRSLSFQHVHDSLQAIDRLCRGHRIPGLSLAISRDWVVAPRPTADDYCIRINENDSPDVPDMATRFCIRPVDAFQPDPANLSVTLPAEKLTFPLTIRPAEKSDRYRRMNTDYDQEVWEMLRERGIPIPLRRWFPLLVNGDGRPVWCFACPLAAAFHCPVPPPIAMPLRQIILPQHPFGRFLT